MKRAQVIGISVAGGAGLLAFVLMRSMISAPSEPTKVAVPMESNEVLVARRDIPLGAVTKDSDFRWQTWPAEAVTPQFITKSAGSEAMRSVSGAVARSPMMAGEPINKNKLVKAGDGGVLAAILPSGMRAISTRIKEETSAGRLILPNDHVDVILTRRLPGSGADRYVSDTLFRNVRVLAIGQQIETKGDKKQAASNANTATLELTPHQAEMLARANSMGEISLSLRSVADVDPNGPGAGTDPFGNERGNAVRILKYGVPSREYGVN